MDPQIIAIFAFLSPILVSFCISIGIGLYLIARRYVLGARSFGVIILLQTAWTLGLLFELISPDLNQKIFWDDMQWIPSAVLTLAFLSFAMEYTGRRFKHPRLTWAALCLIPLSILIPVFTNSTHGLAMSGLHLIPGQPFSLYTYQFGPLLLPGLALDYAALLWGIGILVILASRQRGIYRQQTWIIILGMFIPIVSTLLSILNVWVGPQRDDSPYVFILTNVLIGFGLFRYRVFDLVPVAREFVIDSMEDGEIVLDRIGRLVEINPAAILLTGLQDRKAVGQPLREIAGDWFQQINLSPDKKSVHQEICIDCIDPVRTIDLRITRLDTRQGIFSGHLLILRDITEQKLAEARLEQANAEMHQQVEERTADLSTTLAQMKAEIEERRRAEQAIQRQFQQSRTLVELSSLVLKNVPDLKRVLQVFVQRCVELIGDGASIFFYDPACTELELVAVYNSDPGLTQFFWDYMRQHPVHADEAAYGQVIETKQPILVPWIDMQALLAQAPAERREYYERLPIFSAMFAPLVIAGACIGVLGIGRHKPVQPCYTPEDLVFFQQVADLSAIAIWQARLYADLQKELAERTRGEQLLKESEQKYRALFVYSAEAILLVDHGVFIDCNEGAQHLLGLSRDQILNQRPEDLSTEFQADGEKSAVKSPWLQGEALREGSIRFEWIHQRGDSSPVETEIVLAAIWFEGRPVLQATVRDMTVRKRAEEQINQAYEATLEGWARALELRELETAHHSERVVGWTLKVARKMGFSEEECVHLRRGAILHDIGKMGIPDSILLKPGPLDDREWAVMRQHPVSANNLLLAIPYLRPALDIPFFHQERWDGSGYPLGLKGEQIPLAARIFAVVDVWDALCWDRPYRKAWPPEKVVQYLLDNKGIQFDPQVVDIFLQTIAG